MTSIQHGWFERIPSESSDKECSSTKSPLRKLEQVLIRGLPKSVQLLNICRIICENERPADVDVKFYRYRTVTSSKEWWNEENDRGHFIVCIQRPDLHTKKGVIVLTPTEVTPEMASAFDNFIGWSESQVFQCIQPPFWSYLQDMCTKHNNLKPENNPGVTCVMYAILDLDQSKSFHVLEEDVTVSGHNLYVRPLEDKDVTEIVDQWKWRASHSEQVIRKCIKTFISCGLFIKEEVEVKKEEMVSSVLSSPLGVLNILFTPEKHRRKGYGKIVLKWMAKQLAVKEGIIPLAEVERGNVASNKLLESVGFCETFITKWYYYDPTPFCSSSPPTTTVASCVFKVPF